jgi:hypothetical protein
MLIIIAAARTVTTFIHPSSIIYTSIEQMFSFCHYAEQLIKKSDGYLYS